MDAAFEFRSAPAAGSGITWIRWQSGTRLAADAEIAFVVLRQMADPIRVQVAPNLLPIPVREEAHLP